MPITNLCPYCHEPMAVTRMSCPGCRTSVDASFPSPRLMNLPSEHQRFIEIFILAGGNLKQMAEQAGANVIAGGPCILVSLRFHEDE